MSTPPKPPLNIPQGNSEISPTPPPPSKEDQLTGDRVRDFKTAISRISIWNDLENIGKIPCARSSFLYAIAGGSGIGAVRFLGSRRVLSAANWAVGTFAVVAVFSWETCRAARNKELAQMRMIQEKFPHRHVSNLQRSDEGNGKDKTVEQNK